MALIERFKAAGFRNLEGTSKAELTGALKQLEWLATPDAGRAPDAQALARLKELAALRKLVEAQPDSWVATPKSLTALDAGRSPGAAPLPSHGTSSRASREFDWVVTDPKERVVGDVGKMRRLFFDESRNVLLSKSLGVELYSGDLTGSANDGKSLFFPWGTQLGRIDLATGTRSMFDLSPREPTAIHVAGDELLVLSNRGGVGYFEALDKDTGASLRRVTLSRPYNHVEGCDSQLTERGLLFTAGKHLARLDPTTGTAVSVPAPRGFSFNAVAVRGDTVVAALTSKDRLMVVSYRLEDLSVDREVMNRKLDSPDARSVLLTDENVLISGSHGVRVLDFATGKERGFVGIPSVWDFIPGAKPNEVNVVVRDSAFVDGLSPYEYTSRILRLSHRELEDVLLSRAQG